MGRLQRIEGKLERFINGAFAKAFRAEVQPVEIASAVRRAMDDGATSLAKGRTFVPTSYRVELSDTDYERLAGYAQDLEDELVAAAEEHAETQRYLTKHDFVMRFAKDSALETGVFRIVTQEQGENRPANPGQRGPRRGSQPAAPPSAAPREPQAQGAGRAAARSAPDERTPDPRSGGARAGHEAAQAVPGQARGSHSYRESDHWRDGTAEPDFGDPDFGGPDFDNLEARISAATRGPQAPSRPPARGGAPGEDHAHRGDADRHDAGRNDEDWRDEDRRGQQRPGEQGGEDWRDEQRRGEGRRGEQPREQHSPAPGQEDGHDGGQDPLRTSTRREPGRPPVRPVAPADRPWLEIDGDRYPLLGPVTVLGRDIACSIVVDDANVSRRHCEIRVTHDGPRLVTRIRDLGSTNGTWVEGRRVDSHRLSTGEKVSIGSTAMIFHAGRR